MAWPKCLGPLPEPLFGALRGGRRDWIDWFAGWQPACLFASPACLSAMRIGVIGVIGVLPCNLVGVHSSCVSLSQAFFAPFFLPRSGYAPKQLSAGCVFLTYLIVHTNLCTYVCPTASPFPFSPSFAVRTYSRSAVPSFTPPTSYYVHFLTNQLPFSFLGLCRCS